MSSFRFSLEARRGDFELRVALDSTERPVAVIGPNGSGKSTLLKLLCGALAPSGGRFCVGDRVLFDSELRIDVPAELRRIGYVPQGSGLFSHLDVLDNVSFSLRFGASPVARDRARQSAHAILERLGCQDLARRPTRTLSGGERQRVALARALAMDPSMILFDEPLSALDAGARRRTRTFLSEQLNSWGRPAIVVTHDVRDVEALDAQVLVMVGGRAVQSGSLDELRARPGSDFVVEFLGP